MAMSQVPSDWSFQFNAPTLSGAYNIQPFQHLPQGSTLSAMQSSARAYSEPYNPNDGFQSSTPDSLGHQSYRNGPIQGLQSNAPYHQPVHLQSTYPNSSSEQKDDTFHSNYPTSLPYQAYASHSMTWSPSMKVDLNFFGASQMTRSQEPKRARVDQFSSVANSEVSTFFFVLIHLQCTHLFFCRVDSGLYPFTYGYAPLGV